MKIKYFLIFLFIINSTILSQSKKYTILISFDGFRWDYLNRGLTPNLDMMKSSGVHALSLRPTYPSKTFPNHQSIITGMYNDNHGIISNNFKDPFSKERYRLGDTNAVRESKWYLGEAFWETAKRQGIITASYFWPGSEINYSQRRPNYFMNYEHEKPYYKRIEGILNWLSLPIKERPRFITLYFDATDTYGHKFGTNSPQLNKSIQILDTLIGTLFNGLERLNLIDSINVIVVSDHGMTDIQREKTINIKNLLDGFDYTVEGDMTFLMIDPSEKDSDKLLSLLKKNENHYKLYRKNEIPDYLHYKNNPFIYPILLIADLGWSFVDDKTLNKWDENYSKANHGYDNNHLDMHGIFLAKGPDFKNNYLTGTLWNVDIYPLLCKIFNISPRSNIDGKLERIEFILK